MKTKQWLRKLLGSCMKGGAHAGSAYLALSAAHSSGLDVPAVNFKGLGIMIGVAWLIEFFKFIDQNPLPEEELTTTTTTATIETVTKTNPTQSQITYSPE